MGRRTYESIGRALAGRTTIVITRQADFTAAGCTVVHRLEDAVNAAVADDEAFVVGGSQIYQQALPKCHRIYWTAVDAIVPGDTFFPTVNWNDWRLVSETPCTRDPRNEFDMVFRVYDRLAISQDR
jgi:dihydrofolate reductase